MYILTFVQFYSLPLISDIGTQICIWYCKSLCMHLPWFPGSVEIKEAHTITTEIGLCRDGAQPTLCTASPHRCRGGSHRGWSQLPLLRLWLHFTCVSVVIPYDLPRCLQLATSLTQLTSLARYVTALAISQMYITYTHMSLLSLGPRPQPSRTSSLPVMIFWYFWLHSSCRSQREICFRH